MSGPVDADPMAAWEQTIDALVDLSNAVVALAEVAVVLSTPEAPAEAPEAPTTEDTE